MRFRVALVAAAAAFLANQPIRSEAVELNVTHFGTGMYGVPYAIAKEKGYFKEAGLDVTGFLTSAGGGTTVRNVLASELLSSTGIRETNRYLLLVDVDKPSPRSLRMLAEELATVLPAGTNVSTLGEFDSVARASTSQLLAW